MKNGRPYRKKEYFIPIGTCYEAREVPLTMSKRFQQTCMNILRGQKSGFGESSRECYRIFETIKLLTIFFVEKRGILPVNATPEIMLEETKHAVDFIRTYISESYLKPVSAFDYLETPFGLMIQITTSDIIPMFFKRPEHNDACIETCKFVSTVPHLLETKSKYLVRRAISSSVLSALYKVDPMIVGFKNLVKKANEFNKKLGMTDKITLEETEKCYTLNFNGNFKIQVAKMALENKAKRMSEYDK